MSYMDHSGQYSGVDSVDQDLPTQEKPNITSIITNIYNIQHTVVVHTLWLDTC